MSWVYEIVSGRMLDPARALAGVGYSGSPAGRNDPKLQDRHDVGPIPVGHWLVGPPHDTAALVYCLLLAPMDGTETFGRGGFLIHGDSADHPGTASKGCIVLPRPIRQRIWESNDHELVVVEGPSLEVAC